ncbi:MAG: exodeoxyribonuclease VII large subunit [Eubacteriales bacterium]|nr:exodeoxyribonuclease VII large subunit [Eubacteriales bacterium]MDD4710015.1 exodeoxyribonuclease VII large subunit [Eubacteriales bacterium]
MQASTLTVTALNEYVRRTLAGDPMLHNVALTGEVSNFKQHVSGHWYFSLKDEGARIACVMFRQNNLSIKFVPTDGMRVVLTGSVGLYTASGSYQFYAEGMRKDGVGELYERYLRLKELLSREGLFDPAAKKTLPLYPRAIGIVTSLTGAVLHDIVTVVRRRSPGTELILRPSQVQGEGAARDLAQGLREISKAVHVDVVIIGRGGGSMEDLWAFNEEILVRAIADCPVPVIAAVGHETDVTLADFAADMRAPTPSAAAELAVPDSNALLERIGKMQTSLTASALHCLTVYANQLAQRERQLKGCDPNIRVEKVLHQLENKHLRLTAAVQSKMRDLAQVAENRLIRLNAAGPENTLKRGYVIALDGARPVKSVLKAPHRMTLLFHDGQAHVHTIDRKEGAFFGKEN